LCLNDFEIIGHTCFEPIPSLLQCLVGEVNIALAHAHKFGRRLKVKKSGAHLIVDFAFKVGEFCSALLKRGGPSIE